MSTQIFLNSNIQGLVGLYTQTADSAVIGGAVQTGDIIGTGVGSLMVPANGFAVGDSFKLNMGGHVDAVNNKELTISVATVTPLGTVVLASTNAITMPTCTDEHWNLEIVFTVRSLGPAGVASIVSSGYFMFTKDAANAYEGENFSLINNTTFDTTLSNTLSIKAGWNDNTVGNAIYSETMVLTKIF